MPTPTVATKPIGSGPGSSARPRKPAMMPMTIAAISSPIMVISSVGCSCGDALPRQGLDSRVTSLGTVEGAVLRDAFIELLLALDFGVELSSEQHCDVGQPQPDHQH